MRIRVPFLRGMLAGVISLLLSFIISITGFAPFPPAASIERFVAFVPASIEQPMIQTFGGTAIYIGIIVASFIAAIVYGLFGTFFENYYAKKTSGIRYLTSLEKFLFFSSLPWLFFGIVVLPLSGYGFFGTSSFESGNHLVYPFTLLLASEVYGLVLFYEYRDELFLPKQPSTTVATSELVQNEIESSPRFANRRDFIEKGVLIVGALIFVAFGATSFVSLFSTGGGSIIRSGKPNPPIEGIFSDPRLSVLVDAEITDNNTFYIVDIDTTPPSVDASSWELVVKRSGNLMKSLTLQDIEGLAKTEQYTTLECVSNTVDGNLISNAKWTGVKFSDLFDYVGANLTGADYVVFYSVDSYSVGIPLSKALRSDSIVAYFMNDQPLPTAHGYPLRAVIPGLYGMMSAKWINEINIVDSTYVGYWQTRGYTNDATIKTVSFIRVPQENAIVSLSAFSGSLIIGGMAFAGDRGISKVEISIDGGKTWKQAKIKPSISNLTWTLWAIELTNLSPGNFTVYSRATDGTGSTQTASTTAPFPSGATGYAVSYFTLSE